MEDACVGLALRAMMRSVASEHPRTSWQARDMSADQIMIASDSLSTLATESAAELADGASIVSAPLLVPSVGLQREGLLHGMVGAASWLHAVIVTVLTL